MENEEIVNKQIGKNIATFRKGANLTQAELAQKINYSDKSVSKWESRNGAPDVYVLMSLAELFGVTVNALAPFQRADLADRHRGVCSVSDFRRFGRMVDIFCLRRACQRYTYHRFIRGF